MVKYRNKGKLSPYKKPCEKINKKPSNEEQKKAPTMIVRYKNAIIRYKKAIVRYKKAIVRYENAVDKCNCRGNACYIGAIAFYVRECKFALDAAEYAVYINNIACDKNIYSDDALMADNVVYNTEYIVFASADCITGCVRCDCKK